MTHGDYSFVASKRYDAVTFLKAILSDILVLFPTFFILVKSFLTLKTSANCFTTMRRCVQHCKATFHLFSIGFVAVSDQLLLKVVLQV